MKPTDSGRIIIGLLVFIAGLLLLAENLDWLHVDFGQLFLNFWPLALILVGLRLVISRLATYLAVAVTLILASVLAIAASPESFRSQLMGIEEENKVLASQKLNEPLSKEVSKFTFKLDFGAATIQMNDLKDATKAYEARFENTNQIKEEIERNGNELTIELDQAPFRGYFWERIKNRRAEIALNPDVPLEVELDSGASKQELDFSNTHLQRLKLDSGATSTDIKFGSKVDHLFAEIDSGASSVTLRIPNEVGLRIETDSGLTSTNFEEAGLIKSEDLYQSSDFDTQARKITIRLDAGATSIRLERY